MKRIWLVLATFLSLAATVVPASVDFVWTLNQGSLGPSGTVYGTVTAKQIGTGSTASVEVTIALASTPTTKNWLIATGQHKGITWNMSVTPDTLSIANNASPNGNPNNFTPLAFNGSYTNSPFSNSGNFSYAITPKASNGGSGTETSITFDLTKTGGLSLTDGLFTANSGGYYWAVDIGWNCKTSSNGKPDCGNNTGVVASNSYVKVPEPGTVSMSIAGLMGLVGFAVLQQRRRKQIGA